MFRFHSLLASSLHRHRRLPTGNWRRFSRESQKSPTPGTPSKSAAESSQSSQSSTSTTLPTPPVVAAVVEEGGLFFGTHVWRLACAFGFVYVVTEYGVELTICEGPSMLPTIKPRGEIILMDRFTPRWYGLQGGCNEAEPA